MSTMPEREEIVICIDTVSLCRVALFFSHSIESETIKVAAILVDILVLINRGRGNRNGNSDRECNAV